MILSDRDIVKELNKGSLKIIPCEEKDIQPCSVDLHLGKEALVLNGKRIDLSKASYKLKPKEFLLASYLFFDGRKEVRFRTFVFFLAFPFAFFFPLGLTAFTA